MLVQAAATKIYLILQELNRALIKSQIKLKKIMK